MQKKIIQVIFSVKEADHNDCIDRFGLTRDKNWCLLQLENPTIVITGKTFRQAKNDYTYLFIF